MGYAKPYPKIKDNPKRGHKKPNGISKPLRKVASTIEEVEALNLTESPNQKRGGVIGSRRVNPDSPKFGHPKPVKAPKKAKKRIKPVSKVRASELKTYFQRRKDFLEKHPTCQAKLIHCNHKATEIHHANGRNGKRLVDATYFIALCRVCHDQIHNSLSALEAREKNFKK